MALRLIFTDAFRFFSSYRSEATNMKCVEYDNLPAVPALHEPPHAITIYKEDLSMHAYIIFHSISSCVCFLRDEKK